MSFTVFWANSEQTILQADATSNWTWDEYHQAIDDIIEQMKTVAHPVDVFVVQHQTAVAPRGNHLPHYRRVMRDLPDNHRFIVMVFSNRVGRTMLNMFMRFFPTYKHRIFGVGSVEEAHQLLAEKTTKNGTN